MRIALLTREFPPITRYTGGIGTQFASLSLELARQGHEVHVVTVGDHPELAAGLEGVRVHALRRPPRRVFLHDLGWSRIADHALERLGRFDVVYAAEFCGEAWRYSRHRRAGPLITNLTTSTAQILEMSPGRQVVAQARLAHAVQQRIERRQVERSDALAACTSAILGWSRKLWEIDHVPVRVLPNMVDVDRVLRLAGGPKPDGFPEDGPVIAFSGRVEIRKGAHVLGEAMREVWKDVPEAHLVLMGLDMPYGEGTMGQHIKKRAGVHADRVQILGNQPPERLFPALASADVVALPSVWENFALAALEVLTLGRPLVATATGGYPEFIRDGHDGVLVKPQDPVELAAALTRLLGDAAERERLGEAAAVAATRFAPEPVTRQHMAWFETIAGAG